MTSETLVAPGDWERVIAAADGPQLVVGGPGTGKTEFLVRRAHHLVEKRGVHPEELLVLSFSRRGSADLRNRISARLGRSISSLPTSTFHSLSMRILEAHGSTGDWPKVPSLLTGPEQVALVAEVLATEKPSAWPLTFRDLLHVPAFADEIADFILRAAEHLTDGAAIAAMERDDWRALPAFLERYRTTLVDRNRIDYGTLQVEAIRLLEDSEVQAAISECIRYVLVDEYQDSTIAQAAIVDRIASHRNVTAAGDPYQSIFSFRGAELSNIANFPNRFRSPDGFPSRRIVLTTSFRVPAAILDAAVRVTAGAGLPGAAGPMQPSGPGGSVETYVFDQHASEADWIASEIQRLHLRDRIPYQRIAVLVRSKRRFLPELSRALELRRIPHDRPDARLVDHPAVRPVLDLVQVVTLDVPAANAALKRVLLGPIGRLTLSAAREVERAALRDGWNSALSAAAIQPEIGDLFTDPRWATTLPAAEGFWHIWTTIDAFTEVVTNEGRDGDRRALSSFFQALTRLNDRNPTATLADFTDMSEAEDFEANPLLEYRSGTDRVALSTLHQSKGLSFDVVFIADAREGVLPDLRRRDSLLGARHLSPAHSNDETAYATFRLQEEKRLAYSAICRAAVRIVWTATSVGFEPGEGIPSRFLPLVAGTTMAEAAHPPRPWGPPTTPLEAEAWLRRKVSDPKLPLVERLAAAGALVTPAEWRPRDPATFAGILERGNDTGLISDPLVLSASQADSYTRCGRQYAFERRLRIDAGSSNYIELGSAIHAALEVAERAAAERGDDHATAGEALSALDSVFKSEVFGGGPWASAWRARADRIVERLYELWPGQGPGVAFEEKLDFQFAGVRWLGRIDRVERRGDGMHVVDYKTGGTKVSVSEAAASLQLGLYVIGLRALWDERVAGGEFWYPAADMTRAKTIVKRQLDPGGLAEVKKALEAAVAGILAERWEPVLGGHCGRCSVRLVCPEWPEGREAFLP